MLFLKSDLPTPKIFGDSPGGILIDPGIGFGKTFNHNLTLIKHLDFFQDLDCPWSSGLPGRPLSDNLPKGKPPERDWGTAATPGLRLAGGPPGPGP